MSKFSLPTSIAELVRARNNLREHFAEVLKTNGSTAELHFTLDGNLVGDIGEALAVELFGIELVDVKSVEGYDGFVPGSKTTVQIKATGTGRGPAFRNTSRHADYLLFFDLDLEQGIGEIIYNGPEHYARAFLPESFEGQRSLTPNQIRRAAERIGSGEALPQILPGNGAT